MSYKRYWKLTYQELDGAALQENGNKDIDECGGDEQFPVPGCAPEHGSKGKPNGTAETTVGDYDFLLPTDLVRSELVEEIR